MTRVLNFADGFSTDTVPGITSTITTVSGPIYQDNVSGSNVVLTSIVYSVIRLINGGLVSIDTIPAGAEGQMITVINATGVDVTISNNTGATAANRILTGQKASIVLKDEASIILEYDTNELRWMVVGGTGSGSSSSSDYVTNSDAEAGTTGYATYNNAAGVNPVDATGGSPSITLTASSSSPLFGTKSFLLSKGATNRQGDGVSYDYTLSAGDATQVLSLTMPYSTTANYVDGDIRVGIYDVTNAQIIEGTQRDLAANANGFYVSSFQMPSNSTSFRIFWHVSSTNASAYDIKFDNVILEKKPVVKGAIVTDWISYTPVVSNMGTGSTIYLTGKKRRVGDSCEFVIEAIKDGSSGSGTSNVSFSLPEVLDTTKTTDSSDNTMMLGFASVFLSATAHESLVHVLGVPSTGSVILVDAGTNQGFRGDDFLANTQIRINGSFPVAGWSSNVALSENTGNRIVALVASIPGGQNVTSTAATDVIFNSASYDTTGSLNTGTGVWTCPESGFYNISTNLRLNTFTTGESSYTAIIKNSTTIALGANTSDITTNYGAISRTEYLVKGDTIKIQVSSSTDTSYTISATTTNLAIFKIQTPQSIGQSEAVNCKYTCATGLNLSSSGATYFLDFATKSYDTHDAVLGEGSGIVSTTNTGWRFVCPQAGVYSVSSAIRFVSSAAWASGEGARLDVYKNGSVESEIDYKDSLITTGSPAMVLTGTTDVKCNKGDYLEIGATQSSGGALALNGVGTLNYVAIKKVG